MRHPPVDKISFTGSPEVGREIAIEAARDFRRVTLELGGKSPQIVLADADLDAVLPGVAIGFFANQGEICAAGTRILVARELYDDVVDGLADAARGVRLGDPFDEATTMGALINGKQRDRVTGYIAQGTRRGRRARHRRRAARPAGLLRRADGLRRREQRHRDRAGRDLRAGRARAAVRRRRATRSRIANDTRYGLAAYVWTQNLSEAHRLAGAAARRQRLDQRPGAPDARLPWGGLKTSGIGRELGWAGIEANTEEKTVTITF